MGARIAVTAAVLAALTAVTAATVLTGGTFGAPGGLLPWYAAGWALFAVAVRSLRGVPERAAARLVLAGAAALSLAALLAPPRTSDDMYRYAWDGRVQAAGVSPYAYAPDAGALARLRDGWLFPAHTACHAWNLHRASGGLCTHINRPAVHTVYPPVAEGWYLLVHLLSPADGRHKPLQLAGAALVLATTAALLRVLRRGGLDTRRAALWAWCPAVPFAAVNDAHVDTLGALLVVLAMGVPVRARHGALLGGAIAVKLLPALALPGLLAGAAARGADRWRAARTAAAALAVTAAAYLPYVLVSGAGVIGYLPGYLREEGYDGDRVGRFALARLLLPDRWAGPAAVLAVAAVAVLVLRRGDPGRPWHGALLVTGTAFLATSPSFYWYTLIVVALVALDGRWEWLAVPAAATVLYVEAAAHRGGLAAQAWPFGLAALAVVAGAAVRSARDRQRELPETA